MRWIRRGLAALLLLTLIAAGLLAAYAWRMLPPHEGTLALAGARGEIRIERDALGIPTIVAADRLDAYYGLGVVHAQDRLWQLETHRRIGSGTTAEAFGPAALETDRFLRALGVRRAAEAQWARAPADTRDALQAYAAGINAVVAGGGQARAPEFLLLGLQPGRWEGADSLAWAIMMAWDLGGNWNNELLRLRLALQLPSARVEQLMPPYPGAAPPVAVDYAALYRSMGLTSQKLAALTRGFEAAPESGVEGVGSNNWVLAGSRTTTGAPLLANDPHLKLTSPALWYFARLKAPGLDVAGATMPGLPFVVLGQNADIAWGFTNTGPDVQDLYLEQVDPADPNRVRTPAGYEPLELRTETIRVKGQPDVSLTLRRSRHGPVVSDAGTMGDVLGGQAGQASTHLLALRWTALDADADPVGAGLALQGAGSVDAFFAGTRGFVAPMQSMVVAERAAAWPRARPEGPRAGPRLGRALRLAGLGARGRNAAPAQPGHRLDRHRQPAHRRARLPAPPDTRLGAALPLPAHRAAARKPPEAHAGRAAGDAVGRCLAGGEAPATASGRGVPVSRAGRCGAGAARGLRRSHGRRTGGAAHPVGLAAAAGQGSVRRRRGRRILRALSLGPQLPGHARGRARPRRCRLVRRPQHARGRELRAAERCGPGAGAR
jgi:hypothetical protein